jgi:DNA-binding NarL/FixJ family response regulator
MESHRILLADDEPAMIRAVTQLLDGKFEIVAAVDNGQSLIEDASRLDPDLLVLDISMPVMNGIEAARHLKKLGSRAKVIFLTVHEDRDFIEAAFSAGALGYVLKPCLATDLLPAIREALQGHTFVSSAIGMEVALKSGRADPILEATRSIL